MDIVKKNRLIRKNAAARRKRVSVPNAGSNLRIQSNLFPLAQKTKRNIQTKHRKKKNENNVLHDKVIDKVSDTAVNDPIIHFCDNAEDLSKTT